MIRRLETEVQKMLLQVSSTGYHAAGFIDLFGNGNYTDEFEFGEIFDYFQNPADTIITLIGISILSPTTQQQVNIPSTNYGRGEMRLHKSCMSVGELMRPGKRLYSPEVSMNGDNLTSPTTIN
jgi:hypothetical protein